MAKFGFNKKTGQFGKIQSHQRETRHDWKESTDLLFHLKNIIDDAEVIHRLDKALKSQTTRTQKIELAAFRMFFLPRKNASPNSLKIEAICKRSGTRLTVSDLHHGNENLFYSADRPGNPLIFKNFKVETNNLFVIEYCTDSTYRNGTEHGIL